MNATEASNASELIAVQESLRPVKDKLELYEDKRKSKVFMSDLKRLA